MNTKHTPGEWYWTDAYPKSSDGERTWSLIGSGGYGILSCDGVENSPQGLNNEANARLIAAAPELLEACITFAEWLRREAEGFIKAGNERDTPEGEAKWRAWYSENLRLCDLAQKQARAAVAKATGASHVHDQ